MRTQARLRYIDANRCVVLVTAYGETDVMGSALASRQRSRPKTVLFSD